MGSSPSPALETLLGLPPLHIATQKKALLMSLNFLKEYEYKPDDLNGHLKICERLEEFIDARIVSDLIVKRPNLNVPFNVF